MQETVNTEGGFCVNCEWTSLRTKEKTRTLLIMEAQLLFRKNARKQQINKYHLH